MTSETEYQAVVLNGGCRDGEVMRVKKGCRAICVPNRSMMCCDAMVYRMKYDELGHPVTAIENGEQCLVFQLS